ncbi:MAG: hypothetical protein AAFQ75_12295 [Pseudomonadota bacterium]
MPAQEMADEAPDGVQVLSVEAVPFDDGASVSPDLHDLAVRLKWSRLFQARASDGSLAGAALLARSETAHNLKFDTADARVARALAEHALQLLRRIGYRRLRSWDTVPEGSGELAFLTAAGFTPGPASMRFVMPTRRIRDLLHPLVERLHQRGKVPRGAHVVSLADAVAEGHFAEVAALERRLVHNRAMRLDEDGSEGGTVPRVDHALSRVALMDGVVVALVLGRPIADDTFLVETRAIAPEHRNRWVSPCMMLDGVDGLLAASLTRIEMESAEQNADTLALARKGGALERRRVYRPLYQADTDAAP